MKAVIIEDESWIARELASTVLDVATDVDIIATLPSLKVCRKWFLEHAVPDLIFMDIQLSDGISFSLFEEFDLTCPTIFTTAYEEYAIRAFRVSGIDYLLKPVRKEELERAIAKCRTIHEREAAYPKFLEEFLLLLRKNDVDRPKYKERFVVYFRNQWIPIDVGNIACFVKEHSIYLYTFTGERYLLDFQTMEEIEALVDPGKYFRANRQHIVHIDAIQVVTPQHNARLVTELRSPLNLQIDISREKAPQFRRWFDR